MALCEGRERWVIEQGSCQCSTIRQWRTRSHTRRWPVPADVDARACYDDVVDAFSTLTREPATLLVWCLCGFLAGSVPFGLLLALAVTKTDVRKAGSGNIGATNVARVVGRKLGLLTLVLDACKGLLPVLAVTRGLGPATVDDDRARLLLGGLVGVAALLGHCFTPWLRGRGGKGVATGLGVLLALHPTTAGAGLLSFAVAFAATRIVSVSSLVAALVVIAALFVLDGAGPTLVPMLVCLAVIVVRHTDNIRRLARREELRL
jgi:glycerol-3-phosphate acyltransferase PlsY